MNKLEIHREKLPAPLLSWNTEIKTKSPFYHLSLSLIHKQTNIEPFSPTFFFFFFFSLSLSLSLVMGSVLILYPLIIIKKITQYQNTSKNGDTKDSSKSRGAEDQRLNHRIDDPTTEHKRQGCTSEGWNANDL